MRTFTLKLSLMSDPLISISPQLMGGTPVFAGTRVPVQTLFEYLEAGDTIDDFLGGTQNCAPLSAPRCGSLANLFVLCD